MAGELSSRLAQARIIRPFARLRAEHGDDGRCPICKGPAEIVTHGKFTKDFVEELKRATPIERVAERMCGPLKKSGGNLVAKECPFCRGSGFNVKVADQFFNCFKCEEGGDVIKLIAKVGNLDYGEVLKRLVAETGMQPRYENDARQYLKCLDSNCAAGKQPLDEVAWVAAKLDLSPKDAIAVYLKEAGLWKDQEPPPSVMPGMRGRKRKLPTENDLNNLPTGGDQSTSVPAQLQGVNVDNPLRQRETDVDRKSTHLTVGNSTGDASDGSIASAAGGDSTIPSSPKTNGGGDEPPVIPSSEETIAPAAPPILTENDAERSKTLAGLPVGLASAPPAELRSPAPSASSAPSNIVALPGMRPPDDAETKPEEKPPRPTALERFYSLTICDERDVAELGAKRGMSPERIALIGCRTNRRENLAILKQLAEEGYTLEELVECGLYKVYRKERITKPDPQFYGYGLVKQKSNRAEKRGTKDPGEWAWRESGKCNPILIPYFDPETKKLVALRPHKGFPTGVPPKLYVAPEKPEATQARLKANLTVRVMITEGEFKANGFLDGIEALGPGWLAGALPGIQQVNNFYVFEEIKQWLKLVTADEVVVCFDSEEHGDPKLPGYKAQREKRFDAQIWARVLALKLDEEGYSVKVGNLPEEWRDAKGKADWDGALARFKAGELKLKPASTEQPEPEATSEEDEDFLPFEELPTAKPAVEPAAESAQSASSPPESALEIARAFAEVMRSAMWTKDLKQRKFFVSVTERIINDRVDELLYVLKLPWGGDRDRDLVRELRKKAGKLGEFKYRALMLASAYEEIFGWYYELKLSTQERGSLMKERDDEDLKPDQLWFINVALKGRPEAVAPFRVRPYYVMVRTDGRRDRLVELVNIRGESSGVVAVDESSFTSPKEWRKWLARQGNYAWCSGERALQALNLDVFFKLARKEVKQLPCYGCQRPDEPWFFDDLAIGANGEVILPDKEGVFWVDSKDERGETTSRTGYTYLRNTERVPIGDEDQPFTFRVPPRMCPGWGLRQNLENQLPDSWVEFELAKGEDDDIGALRELTAMVGLQLQNCLGGYDGWLFMGGVLAFAGGPELYKMDGEFPGVFVSGEKGSGKTYLAKWATSFHGFGAGYGLDGKPAWTLESGIELPPATGVGLQVSLGQYANLMVWADEYLHGSLKHEVQEVIHMGFNRGASQKYTVDGKKRTLRTNFMVTGETTADRSATLGRFIMLLASKEKRAHPSRERSWSGAPEEQLRSLEWMKRNRKFFFCIFRHLLQHRPEFITTLLAELDAWQRLPDLASTDARSRKVYGVPYATLAALQKVLAFTTDGELKKFQQWLVRRTVMTVKQEAQTVNVNEFWIDLYGCLNDGGFGHSASELKALFKVMVQDEAHPPGAPNQGYGPQTMSGWQWRSVKLYFKPEPVIAALLEWKRKQGKSLPLNKADLRSQMSSRPYWVPFPEKSGSHQQRFGEDGHRACCWCVNLDQHEMGYLPVSDEEYAASFRVDGKPDGELFPSRQWIDPRKGQLWMLVERMEKKKEQPGPDENL